MLATVANWKDDTLMSGTRITIVGEKGRARVFRVFSALLLLIGLSYFSAAKAVGEFRAGSSAIDITPETYPVRVNGMFTERTADSAADPLFARAMALGDGAGAIVLCVVDTCMMEQDLIDAAKASVSSATGLATDRMMVSATHTHSAPSAMACLGSRQDPVYAAWLPGKIAEAIVAALESRRPARIGWASVDDWEHTHNRRWIRRADKTFEDPFGVLNVRAHMHPGYESPDVIGPSGPVDPELSLLAAVGLDGTPIALLANYSQHYYSSPLLSADYYGAFARSMARRLGQSSSEGPFVAMMSQGTSGDLMWMDYGSPKKEGTFESYAEEVAAEAMVAYEAITWHDHVPVGIVEKTINLPWRVSDEERLAKARERVTALNGEIPKAREDIYAHEVIYLHEMQRTDLKLQAIRIGDLTIATLPNEVYAITGLKLKRQAPLGAHFNIELANGSVGYIPPPEQHDLGGYTTWPARTAGLDVGAEPAIVETLLGALEEVTGANRKPLVDGESAYRTAVKALEPSAYWRLNEIQGRTAHSAIPDGPEARLSGGAALYLPGPGSGTGWGAGEHLRPSNFSAPGEINRAVHFVADGMLEASIPAFSLPYSVAFWFWLGEKSGASDREGSLVTLPSGGQLRYAVSESGTATVLLAQDGTAASAHMTETALPLGDWHLAVVVAGDDGLVAYIDGDQDTPETTLGDVALSGAGPLRFAEGLEGKLDEIAVFPRALDATARHALWEASGMAAARARQEAEREQAEEALAARATPPSFPDDFAAQLAALKPRIHAPLNSGQDGLTAEKGVQISPAAYAATQGGRLRGSAESLGEAYSVSLWFKNTLPNDVRAVTAYLFSRGPASPESHTGDHLGIGGTFREGLGGRLLLFNGNAANTEVAGKNVIPPDTWNHVVLARDGDHVRAWLNGELEIDAALAATASDAADFFLAARSDHFAPLTGHLAHFALFDRALTPEEAQAIHAASGQPSGTPAVPPKAPPQLDSPPRSPEEGLATIQVPEGYTVDLVAAEPLLLDPVAFDWDTRGRLWVVEMADYPLGLDGDGAAGGRVRMLEDRNGDGVYDESTLFADGLNFPTGILTWRDGVIVTAAPDILFLRDTTGDGRADDREVLFTGLSEGNQQLRANGLRWGLDNWVYVAAGGHHGKYALDTKLHSTRADTETVIGSRDFRFRPDTGALEAQSGPTQFGRNRDDWGNWFGTQNARPLWHYALPDHYLQRNPHFGAPDGQVQVLGEVGPPVFPASPLEKRYHDFKSSGHYTSACSGMIYRDALLFPAGEMNGFTCEPFHNVVQRIALEPDGVTFTGTRAGAEGEPDFFASTDRWCRPVMARTGPDGGLWIADMYRYMIEHPHWLPEEGRAELLPHYREGDDKGRIYRVMPAGATASPAPDLEGLDAPNLVAKLASANGWVRDKAQQLLLWRKDDDAREPLRSLAQNADYAQARLHALCTLDGLDALSDDLLLRALEDTHPGVRKNALRLAESLPTAPVIAAALRLAGDPDPQVRQQLAFSLGAFPPAPETADVLAAILLQDHEAPFITAAALSSALPHQAHLIETLAHREDAALPPIRLTLAEMALSAGDTASLAALFTPPLRASLESLSQDAADACAALLDLLARRGTSPSKLAEDTPTEPVRELAEGFAQLTGRARATLADEGEPAAMRLAAATVLARTPGKQAAAVSFLATQLSPMTPPDHVRLALDILPHTADERVAGLLVGAWPGLTPPAREQAADVLLSRLSWTRALLDAMPVGAIRPTDLSAIRRTRLLNHPDDELRALAGERLQMGTNPERAEVVADYKPALTLPGDAGQGRAKFEELCASCHRLGDLGLEVGPDLRTVIDHPKEKLLANILDPNLDIQPGYHAYNCELEDGEQLFGLIMAENATSITMKLAGGQVRTILRGDIYALESTSISMMPDGLEAGLSPRDMANLLAFLKSK